MNRTPHFVTKVHLLFSPDCRMRVMVPVDPDWP